MRHALGMPRLQLAAILGVEPETLARWESADGEPDAVAFAWVGAMVAEAR